MAIQLAEGTTNYRGQKQKVAVILMLGRRFPLGLADTQRAAHSLDSAERTLINLAKSAGVEDYKPEGDGVQLHQHCRQILGLKDEAEA